MKLFVTGATGFIGKALTAALVARGDTVVAMSRRPPASDGGEPRGPVEWVAGDPTEAGPWQERVAGCDVVVHLAGENVAARRWNREFKELIRGSRVLGTQHVVAAMSAAPAGKRPRALVCANGIDWYPADPSEKSYDESEPRGPGFMAEVCAAWQAEAMAAEPFARVVIVRTGIVLGRGEGALARLITPFKLFVGGPLGGGRFWFSWIHLDDAVGSYLHAIDREAVVGPMNQVAPETVRQREFARALGRAMGRPSWLPAPSPAVRLVAGELADYLFAGRQVVPAALEKTGYEFKHPALPAALSTLV